ncbi:MAG: hypothetical protein IJS12_09465 [Lachnospiraceae bacterium]|nr:hypothetical protein [Lachnospiraceae bacterium]
MTDYKRVIKSIIYAAACVCLAFALTACGDSGSVTQTHIEATQTFDPGEQHAEADADGGTEEAPAGPVCNLGTALSVPTQITRIGDFYFIVDCYNNQVIYSDSTDKPLNEWYVMTSDIDKGHTVASDGGVYLVDDTERHRVLVFEYDGSTFINTQIFENIGTRPHFIVYNEADGCFYVWSSMTGEMYVFERSEGSTQMYISRIMKLDELDGVYVRSFTIDGDSVYLVSGNSQIIEARLSDFKVLDRYPVPDELAGMIQIMPVDGGFYITISTDVHGNQDFATIIYAERLSDLESGGYADIYSYFVGGGTPYYMGEIDGRFYLTEHRLPGHSVWSFDIGEDHMPADVTAVY